MWFVVCVCAGMRLDAIPEMDGCQAHVGSGDTGGDSGGVGGGAGQREEPTTGPVVVLSENPETGQSEVEHEEVGQEVREEAPVLDVSSGGDSEGGGLVLGSVDVVLQEAPLEEGESETASGLQQERSEVGDNEPKQSIQLRDVAPILSVRILYVHACPC